MGNKGNKMKKIMFVTLASPQRNPAVLLYMAMKNFNMADAERVTGWEGVLGLDGGWVSRSN